MYNYILAVIRKVGHLDIKVFNFAVRILIGLLANTVASQLIGMRVQKLNILFFNVKVACLSYGEYTVVHANYSAT